MSTAAAVSLSVRKALNDSSVAFAILKADRRRSVPRTVSEVRAVASVCRLRCATVYAVSGPCPIRSPNTFCTCAKGVLLLKMGFQKMRLLGKISKTNSLFFVVYIYYCYYNVTVFFLHSFTVG